MRRTILCLSLAAPLALVACQSEKKADQPAAPAAAATTKPVEAPKPAEAAPAAAAPAAAGVSAEALAEAKTVFETRCSTCHGLTGAGDGPASAALNPKPRTLADAEWQKKVTDEHIAQVIVKGGESVGLSPLMTANPDLDAKPEVVKGLVQIIRGLAH
jgi:mono/diheme cytochrome c family protein